MRRTVGISTLLAVVAAVSLHLARPSVADTGHVISISDQTAWEGSGGRTREVSMTVTVGPPPQVGEEISVDWATSDAPPATARSGDSPLAFPEDYEFRSGRIVFGPLQTTRTITTTIRSDDADEVNETFLVNLFNPQVQRCSVPCTASGASIGDGRGMLTITDDDRTPSIAIDDVSHAEGNSGVTAYGFIVARRGGSDRAVSVDYATAHGTASGDDYNSASGTLTFDPSDGNTTRTVTVMAVGDTTFEPTESFFVNLFNVRNGTISDGRGVGTIVNDDPIPPPHVDIDEATVEEGNVATFTVTLSSPPGLGQSATVNYDTEPAEGTASSDDDYLPASGSILFGPGERQRTVAVTSSEDSLDEPNESFVVHLRKPETCCAGGYDYAPGDDRGLGTLTDNDAPTSTLAIDDVTVSEGNSGTVSATFTVTKNGTTGQTITVDYSTADGTARASDDYATQSDTLTLVPSESSKTVTVQVLGDVRDEPAETFAVNLSNATHASLSDNQALGTITDDDDPSAGGHDFNGDGYADAVFVVPDEDLGSMQNAGAVNVVYGTASGLSASSGAPTDQLWHLDVAGVAGSAAASDRFGSAAAIGDFNRDGFADLAIGSPGKTAEAGAVAVVYGSLTGLNAAGSQLWDQSAADVEDTAEPGDAFGTSLSAGDFDGDGYVDLAIGVPGEAVGAGGRGVGATNVLYGSVDGLIPDGDQFWHQDTAGVPDTAEADDGFGGALAAGDFDGDGVNDLAVGARGESVGSAPHAGAATVLRGSEGGLTAANSQSWHQDVANVNGVAERGDGYSSSLASGDFNADGFADLASGVPGEDLGRTANAGGANVLYGSVAGLAAAGDQFWSQDGSGVGGVGEAGDGFGSSLHAGDLGGDGRDDLAVGARGEDVGSKTDAGAANVLYGTSSGLSATGNQVWHQDVAGVAGVAEKADHCGAALSSGDFNGDGRSDLVVGAPSEDVGAKPNAGAANVLYATDGGLRASGSQLWHQDVPGVAGGAENGDGFAGGAG